MNVIHLIQSKGFIYDLIQLSETSDVQLKGCLKEMKLMRHLEHPNIIRVLDTFISNDEVIIITEWAERGDLKNILRLNQEVFDIISFDINHFSLIHHLKRAEFGISCIRLQKG